MTFKVSALARKFEGSGIQMNTLSDANFDDILARAVHLHNSGNFEGAHLLYSIVLTAAPDNALCWRLIGFLYLRHQRLDLGIGALQKSLGLNPEQPDSSLELGKAYYNKANYAQAINFVKIAINSGIQTVESFFVCGLALHRAGLFTESIKMFDASLFKDRNFVSAYYWRGISQQTLNSDEMAELDFLSSLKLRPAHTDSLNGLAVSQKKRGDLTAAAANLARALVIEPAFFEAICNLSGVLGSQFDFAASIKWSDRARSIGHGGPVFYNNRGLSLLQIGDHDGAFKEFETATQIDHNFREANWNKAWLYLLNGDYARGWHLFEWRHDENQRNFTRRIKSTLANRRKEASGIVPILRQKLTVHADAGLGDTIQFSRFFNVTACRNFDLEAFVQTEVVTLLQKSFPSVRVRDRAYFTSSPDLAVPLMSLPYLFDLTQPTDITGAPYLTVDGHKKTFFLNNLSKTQKPRIGIKWFGNKNYKFDKLRSMSLNEFLPILNFDAEFHFIGKDIDPNDAHVLRARGVWIHEDKITDFSDTAALVAAMDCIISTDTSIVHLAGALGIVTHVLLPFAADWRWERDRTDSPWYNSLTLYRQSKNQVWDGPIHNLMANLETWVNQSGNRPD